MFSKAYSAALHGIDAVIISVEADISDGLPLYDMVGFLASEVKEARERVKIAIKNSGFRLNSKRITINLSPADLRKEGTAFDLGIAISILSSYGFVSETKLSKTVIVGELSLDGAINPVNGILSIVNAAKNLGFYTCIVPKKNEMEGAVVQDIDVIGVTSLAETVNYLNDLCYIEPSYVDVAQLFANHREKSSCDFADITGQKALKRAIEIAVSGLHNILMIGPPGTGKTMIAKRISTIMPDLTLDESMELTKIYSVTGAMKEEEPLILSRPFRAPHHTITTASLIGGGKYPKPGEISLAHKGVLFLDEFPEFNKHTIEVLRQPLEERYVTISRLNATFRFPAGCMVVCACNPCNCGYYPDRNRCHCTAKEIRSYLGKISQPILDRIDITAEALRVEYEELEKPTDTETSEQIRERVSIAQKIQIDRYQKEPFHFNSELTPKKIKQYCHLGNKEKELLKSAYHTMNLSARAYHRIIKVARTVADLDQSAEITTKHLSEAICLRSMDMKYWGNNDI